MTYAADMTSEAMSGRLRDPSNDPIFANDPSRPATVRRLLASAVRALGDYGFEGTTTRQICHGAGLSSGALYVHFASKEQVLFEISIIGHSGALESMRSAVADKPDPTERLYSAVHAFVLFHAEHQTLARVIQYELRVLNSEHFSTVAAIRRDIDSVIRDSIQTGVTSGDFGCTDIGGAALAIESLAIDVARWFDPSRSSRTPDALAGMYAQFALHIVQAALSGTAR